MYYIVKMSPEETYTYLNKKGCWILKPQTLSCQKNRASALGWVRSLKKFASQGRAKSEIDSIKKSIKNNDRLFLTTTPIYSNFFGGMSNE